MIKNNIKWLKNGILPILRDMEDTYGVKIDQNIT
jgi:hypothetical protein